MLVGQGLRAAYPGAEEVPDDDQNDVGRVDVGHDAAVPAQEVQCGGLMYVVAAGERGVLLFNLSDISINFMCCCCCFLRV